MRGDKENPQAFHSAIQNPGWGGDYGRSVHAPLHDPHLANQPVSGGGSLNAAWVPLGSGSAQRSTAQREHPGYNRFIIGFSLSLSIAALAWLFVAGLIHGFH